MKSFTIYEYGWSLCAQVNVGLTDATILFHTETSLKVAYKLLSGMQVKCEKVRRLTYNRQVKVDYN